MKNEYSKWKKKEVPSNKKNNICIRYNKPGGTIFTIENGKYHATCKNQTCCFEILLIMPVENITIENKLIRMKEKENSHKEKIIKQKMETLFGYKELSISVKEFKKQITGIMQDN